MIPPHAAPVACVTESFGREESKKGGKEAEVTYDGNDQTDPPHAFVQGPDAITEKSLDDEGNERVHCRTVNGRESGVSEAIHVAESSNKPVVDIAPGECRLNCLNKKDRVSL